MGDQRITSDDWVPYYKKEFSGSPVFPSNPAPFSGDGDCDVAIPDMDPALSKSLLDADNEKTQLPAMSLVFSRRATHMTERVNTSEEKQGDLPDGKCLAVAVSIDETPKAPQYVRVRKWDILAEKTTTGDRYCDITYYRKIESMICNRYQKAKKKLTKNELKMSIAKYVKENGGRFLMKDEQNRCFEMDRHDVEQLELPVRDVDISKWDILAERGGRGNHHPGNKRYRKIVMDIQDMYQDTNTSTNAKGELSKHIVEHVKSYGGRFLKKDWQDCYFVMEETKAIGKTSQALRELEDFTFILDTKEVEAFYKKAAGIAEKGRVACRNCVPAL